MYYTKHNRRYHPVEGDPHMQTDGVWLVQTTPGCKSKRVLRQGDLPQINQKYIELQAHCHEDLSRYLNLKRAFAVKESLRIDGDMVSWSDQCNSDFADDILAFLSMTKTARRELIDKLGEEWAQVATDPLDGSYEVRSANGMKLVSVSPHGIKTVTPIAALDKEHLRKQHKKLSDMAQIYERLMK